MLEALDLSSLGLHQLTGNMIGYFFNHSPNGVDSNNGTKTNATFMSND